MPSFSASIELVDYHNRPRKMIVETSSGVADFAAADTLISSFVTDLKAISQLRVIAYTVHKRVIVTDSVTTNANKDEGCTLAFRKIDGRMASIKVPAPIDAIRNIDGTIDTEAAEVVAYVANWLAEPGLTLSGGELASEFVGGTLDV